MKVTLRIDAGAVSTHPDKVLEREYSGLPDHIGRQMGSDIARALQAAKENHDKPYVVIRGDLIR